MIISSLGSGTSGDIIYLFQDDICGESESIPRHARSFGNLFELKKQIYNERVKALSNYKEAVFNDTFPNKNEIVKIDKAELEKFKKLIS